VRVGPEFVPPEITLKANPLAGNAPISITFDASDSFDPDGGTAFNYEWDWESDGIYDADTGSVPTAMHIYTVAGDYTATVRVTDDDTNTSTASIDISATDLVLAADTLYAIPLATHAAVNEPVRILVATGQPAHPLVMLSSVAFTVEQAGAYVPDSFNFGIPGGTRSHSDGYWALLGPPPPGDGQYIDLGDNMIPGSGTIIDGGLLRLTFVIVTNGMFKTPASIGNGAVLFSFEVTFDQPGTYHPGFQLNDGSYDQTYYSDDNVTPQRWGALDQSYTITIE
jgi:PKD repeat protein